MLEDLLRKNRSYRRFDADVAIDTSDMTPAEATREVLFFLERQGYIAAPDTE